jgi:hypothetical protein
MACMAAILLQGIQGEATHHKHWIRALLRGNSMRLLMEIVAKYMGKDATIGR